MSPVLTKLLFACFIMHFYRICKAESPPQADLSKSRKIQSMKENLRGGYHLPSVRRWHDDMVPVQDSSAISDVAIDCLESHNAARIDVGVNELVWNETIAQQAFYWASELASFERCLYLEHGDHDGLGQNLFASSSESQCSEAVSSWIEEKENYVYSVFNAPESSGSVTGDWEDIGHYTQVVWKSTIQIGCATAGCSDGSFVWVCNYFPPGNRVGEWPY